MNFLDLLFSFWEKRREAPAGPIAPPPPQTAPAGSTRDAATDLAPEVPVYAVGDPGWVPDDLTPSEVLMKKPLPFAGQALPMGALDLNRAAKTLSDSAGGLVEMEALEAVMTVESAGDGFLTDGTGRAPILFEAHKFSDFTAGRFDKLYPKLSSPSWNRDLYLGGAREYERLEAAVKLDRNAALRATSWGMFQILGDNHLLVGYNDIEAFVFSMAESEGHQLDAFVQYVVKRKLARHLVAPQRWDLFAAGYNGSAYRANKYDVKLASAYRQAKGVAVLPTGVLRQGDSGNQVKLLQAKLIRTGEPITADGVFGPATRFAVERFQVSRMLVPDGIVGPATWAALG